MIGKVWQLVFYCSTLVWLMSCGAQLTVRDEPNSTTDSSRGDLNADEDTIELTQDEEGTPDDGESPDENIEDDIEIEDDDPVIDDDSPDPEPEPDPNEDDPDLPDGQTCNAWQDCGPHYGDSNSGYECLENTCTCDPAGQWSATCGQNGGYFVFEECLCVFADAPPPAEGTDQCYWTWEQGPCDPDRWVDTSHYEDECSYNSQDVWECHAVWVESGYWEAGDCPAGYWLEIC
jgi:hypothetical protein